MKINIIKNNNLRKKPETPPTFGSVFTNYMFTMNYSNEKGWYDASIKPFNNFEISPAALCFHYGQTIFEGLKVIKNNDKRVLFRADANYKRFNESAKRMCMPEIDIEFALKATKELIKMENDEWFYEEIENSSVYIRPFMFASEPTVNVKMGSKYTFMIILSPMASYFTNSTVDLITETKYMRVATHGTGEAKNGGNYGGSFAAADTAYKNGYSQVLWLDPVEQKYVEEAGMMNVFFVVNDKLITPEASGSILKGITRDSVIKIASDLNFKVEERKIDINDIVLWYNNGELTEAFATGTAASIQPLNSLTHNNFKMMFEYNEDSKCNVIFKHLEDIKHQRVEDKYNFIQTF